MGITDRQGTKARVEANAGRVQADALTLLPLLNIGRPLLLTVTSGRPPTGLRLQPHPLVDVGPEKAMSSIIHLTTMSRHRFSIP